jgi:hypothetical protein
MKKFVILMASFATIMAHGQNVGIGVPNPQNKLHVGGGLRLDTLTGVGGAGLVRHDANGVVYGIKFSGNNNDVLRGDGSFGAFNVNGAIGWLLNGNSGTNPASHFLGTTDNQPLLFRVNNLRHGYLGSSIFFGSGAGKDNTAPTNIGIGNGALASNLTNTGLIAIGDSALFKNSIGSSEYDVGGYNNIAIGYKALYGNFDGQHNTAVGHEALRLNSFGSHNTAFGALTLSLGTSGSFNSAFGSHAMSQNLGSQNSAFGYFSLWDNRGFANSAFGYSALIGNTTGSRNVAIGNSTLISNLTGGDNVAIGVQAMTRNNASGNTSVGYRSMLSNTIGVFNNAFGAFALETNVDGPGNSAFGWRALQNNRAGTNSAFGAHALLNNQTGGSNTAIGYSSLINNQTGGGNTGLGFQALSSNLSGFFNTGVGHFSGTSLPNNVTNVITIGFGVGWNTTLSNHVNVGNFSVQWIGGQTGWFHYSDKRIKNDIRDDVPGLEFINRLKPITYHVDIDKQEEIANSGKVENKSELIQTVKKDWEGKYDVEKIKMSGFFAQDVEDAANEINYSFNGIHNPKNGGLLSLDYSAFVVPLVKAMQEQQSIIEKQQKLIDELMIRVSALEKK